MSNKLMTLEEFHKETQSLGKNEVILDVRNPDEFQEAHLKNALNIPVTEVAQHVEKLKGYEAVYIHCKRGGRAKTAYETLKNAGLTNLVCVHDAGMDAWIEKGYPVEK
jgi:phage shock protein E